MDLRFIDIPKIENDIVLEDLAKDMLEADTSYENINVNGRPGQKQNGIDVYARLIDTSKWVGVQCKVRSTNKSFTKTELLSEVNQAKNFNPKISEYYLYTTLSRDNITQGFEREINDELTKEGSFKFQILFWEDIENKLRQKQFETVYYRYYHKYFRDNLVLGHAIGKLVNLELQFDGKSDTHCELIIGKIPRYKDDKGTSADYFRGTYFIVNLLDKKLEFFLKAHDSNKAVCFPLDIIHAFDNQIDCYRICKWLKEIDDIDNFIYNDKHNYTFSIPDQERWDYFKDEDE